jgi:hypothetical protein
MAFLLNGPTSVPVGSSATFHGILSYNPVRNPFGAAQAKVVIPSGFLLAGLNTSPNITAIRDGATIFLNGQFPDQNPLDVSIILRGVQPGPFSLSGQITQPFGDNSNLGNDNPFLSGTIMNPTGGADVSVGPIDLDLINLLPYQHTIVRVPISNVGGQPATDVKVKILTSPGAGFFFTPNGGFTFDPTGPQFLLQGGLPAGGQTDLRVGLFFDTPGTKTIGALVQQAEQDPDTSNNANSGTTVTVTPPQHVDLLDFGDAPNTYLTLKSANGPSHYIGALPFATPSNPNGAEPNMILGASADAELDGQPSFIADGDGSDEDGIKFLDELTPGQTARIQVTIQRASRLPYLDAYIDWNHDGVFSQVPGPNEDWEYLPAYLDVANPNPLLPVEIDQSKVITIHVPTAATPGLTFARFRLSSAGHLGPGGPADDGEVEDYSVEIVGQQAAPPNLRFAIGADGSVVMTFDTNAVLTSAPDVAGPWTNTGQHSPVTINPNAAKMFFRAVIP